MRFIIPLVMVFYVLLGGQLIEEQIPLNGQDSAAEAAEDDGGMIIEEDFEVTLGENEFG